MASNEDVVKVNSSFGAKQIRYLSYIANANKCLYLYLYQVLLYYDRPVGQDVILQLCFLSYYLRQGGYVLSVFVCLFVSNFAQKLPNGFARNFQGRLAMGK